MSKSLFVAACVACLLVGYLVACVPGFDPVNPFVPKRPDRPIARFLARLAKVGLWVMVFADPPPQDNRLVYARSCNDGEMLCHMEGW